MASSCPAEETPAVWTKDWGVHIAPFGSGQNAVKYLGAYVKRIAIGDSRIVSVGEGSVTFTWKDRAHADRVCRETLGGTEFVRRYLRHVLPRGLHSVRYFGFCHPAAKRKRERIAFLSGCVLKIGAFAAQTAPAEPLGIPRCPCCQRPMKRVQSFPPSFARGPPQSA